MSHSGPPTLIASAASGPNSSAPPLAISMKAQKRPGFSSRFLYLKDGPSIELMQGPWINGQDQQGERQGYAHLALSLGSREAVDALATKAAASGILLSPARMTGDGFYEAVLRDPDGNPIEITA